MSQSGTFPALNASTPTSNIYSYDKRTDTNYDAAGNETNIVGVCPAAGCLSYNAENWLVGYSGSGASYGYDGNGNRIYKLIGGVYTVYVYDQSGNLAAQYSSGTAGAAPCVTCFLSWDHLGSTRMVTDQSGKLIARHEYLPFGEEITNGYAGRPSTGTWGGSDSVAQKFTGQLRDLESGLDYFGARYYGSALGRFTSPDQPLVDQQAEDPQSWNLYSYVRNNPLANVNRWGLDCVYAGDYSQTGTVGVQSGLHAAGRRLCQWDDRYQLTHI